MFDFDFHLKSSVISTIKQTKFSTHNITILVLLITAERTYQQQELRQQLLREMCNGDKEAFSEGKYSLDDLSDEEMKNLIVDDNHGIIYCYIPKVINT